MSISVSPWLIIHVNKFIQDKKYRILNSKIRESIREINGQFLISLTTIDCKQIRSEQNA